MQKLVVVFALVLGGCASSVAAPPTPLPTALVVPQDAVGVVPPLPTLTPTTAPTPVPTPTPSVVAALPSAAVPQTNLLDLVNQLRAANGCPPLAADDLLALAAQAHAEDMRDRTFIDHVGSDGARYQDRLDRVRFPYQLYGENIAANFGDPQEVMSMWTEGDEIPNGPHRLNILNCAYTAAGIGVATSEDSYTYWVLDLASIR